MHVTNKPTLGRFAASIAMLMSLSLGVSWAQTAPSSNTTGSPSSTDDQTVVLSPFEVRSTEDTGYRAQNTLAGSRISTPLSDLAAPISVITKDFLTDIGAVDVNQVLQYQAGMEGVFDFQANNPQLGRTTDNATQDPTTATRGRGLKAPDITRDYFFSLTTGDPVMSTQGIGMAVGFDTYNLDNVTIVRGPNSILAGLGSPSGIINYAPQLALLTRNSTDVSYRYGSYNDQRAVFNTNIVLKPKTLAIRAAGVWNDKGFEQKPAWDHDKRYYLAGTWKPFAKTTVRASYENISVNQKRPNTLTPEDDISQWIALGKPSSPAPGVSVLRLSGAVNNGQPANMYVDANGNPIYAYNNANLYAFYAQNVANEPLWQPQRMHDNTYGDWHKLNISGTIQDMRLSTQEISIDQEVLPGLSVNFAWLHELGNDHQVNTVRPDYVIDTVDVNQKLPSGQPNPHYGETYMYFAGLDAFNQVYSTNVVTRGSATYNLDLTKYNKWLGRYVFTGFAEARRTKEDFNDYNVNSGTAVQTGGGPGVISYTGGTAANGYRMTSAPVSPSLFLNAPFLNPDGTITKNYSTFETLKEEFKSITKLHTSALVIQGYLLDNLAVGTFGVRKDKNEQGFISTPGVDATAKVVLPLPASQYFDPKQGLGVAEATTRTYGVVLHGPKMGGVDLSWLSAGYNQSENFVPNAGSNDLLGNPVSNPTGKSKDWSVSAALLGGKLNVKIDWYKTMALQSPDASVNFPLVQWEMPFSIIGFGTGANPDPNSGPIADIAKQAGVTNFKSLLGPNIKTGDASLANAYASDQLAKGTELELTYNVTKNWRLFATVTKTEAKRTNIASALTTLISSEVAYWKSIGIWDSPLTSSKYWSGRPETVQQIFSDSILGREVAYLSADGQPSQQLHKWKATLVTNYTFDHGPLDHFGVGGALAWLDKTIIGNPAIVTNGAVTGLDLAHPYTTSPQTHVNLWTTYSMTVRDKYKLLFRFEIDNVDSNGGYRAISASGNGTHSVYAIQPPRTYYLTTEVKF